MKSFLQNKIAAGEAMMVGVVVATLVAIIVGVMIWYKINNSLFYSMGVQGAAAKTVNATYNTINTTANTIWTLFPIVAIVIIAGIILAIVTNFGRSGA
jgi:hypothetical protein